jgi:hypothetical protein
MYQHYKSEAGRREGTILAAGGTYRVHRMYPSRDEHLPIVRIEEDDRGVLDVTVQGYESGPHRIHLQHRMGEAA